MSATTQGAPIRMTLEQLQEKARLLRIHSMRATTAAGSGHPTSCLSAAEIMAALFFHAMKFDPRNPNAIEGDRFEHYLPDMQAIAEFKTSNIDMFLEGAGAMADPKPEAT